MLSRMTAGVEPASPLPRIGVVRIADASCDRADAHVTVIDVPAIWPFRIPAAGERGHAALKRGLSGSALVSGPVVSRGCSVKAMKRMAQRKEALEFR
jgi:hypothetical protein